MVILSNQPNYKLIYIRFTTTTASLIIYKCVGICPTQNKEKSVISTFIIKDKVMTPETGTSPLAAVSSGWDGDATTSRGHKTTTKSRSIKVVRGRGWGGQGLRGGHQGHARRRIHFNWQAYMSLIGNFKGEVDDFGAVLGSTAEQREDKDQYK